MGLGYTEIFVEYAMRCHLLSTFSFLQFCVSYILSIAFVPSLCLMCIAAIFDLFLISVYRFSSLGLN